MSDFMEIKKEAETESVDSNSTQPKISVWRILGGLVAPSLSVFPLYILGIGSYLFESAKESPLLFILPALFSFIIFATIWHWKTSIGLLFMGYSVAYVGYSLVDLLGTTSNLWTWNVKQLVVPLLIGLSFNGVWWLNRTRLLAKEFPSILVGFVGLLVAPIGLIIKYLIPYDLPDFLIGVPVPMVGASLLPIGGYLFGLFGGLISYVFFKAKKAAIIGSAIGGLAFNLIITPMPQ